MKIDNSIKSPTTVASDNKTRAARETTAGTNNQSTVELSGRLAQLDQLIADTPVVDSGKVAEIRQAMSEGRFQVNPEKVADGLIDSVRQMLAAQPRSA